MGTLTQDLTSIALDAALVTATSAFAAWLDDDDNKRHEPDKTWLEVVFGVGLCLTYASARSRLTGLAHERAVWRAFALGGAPVIVGEVAQWRERLKQRPRWEALDAEPDYEGLLQ